MKMFFSKLNYQNVTIFFRIKKSSIFIIIINNYFDICSYQSQASKLHHLTLTFLIKLYKILFEFVFYPLDCFILFQIDRRPFLTDTLIDLFFVNVGLQMRVVVSN